MSEPIINHFQGTFCPKSYAALKRQINWFSNFKRGFSHIISYQDIAGGCRTKALLDFEPQFWSIQVKNLFYWTHGRSLCTLVPCQQTGRLSRSCSFDLIDVALGGGRRRLQLVFYFCYCCRQLEDSLMTICLKQLGFTKDNQSTQHTGLLCL